MGAGGGPGGLARPHGEHDDGPAALAEAAERPDQLAAVGEGLQVQHDRGRGLMAGEVGEDLPRRDVGLVAHRDEPRDSDARFTREPRQLQPELPGLRHDPERAGDEVAPGQIELRRGVVDPETVRSDQTGSRRAHALGEPGLVHPGGDREEAAHAQVERLGDDPAGRVRRHAEHHELGHFREGGEPGDAGHPLDDGS